MQKEYDIPLHDIKPLLDIEEYSLYYLLGVSLLGVVVVGVTIYLLFRWYQKRKSFNIREEHLRVIRESDIDDTKKYAYLITSMGATFAEDSPRHSEMYKNLTQRLVSYKYKKSVERFDEETLGYIELYKEMLDV